MKNRWRVKPGETFRIDDYDPRDAGDLPGGKEQAEKERESIRRRLEELQELLWAEHRHKLLIVLQGMDTSGKDGAIRYLMDGFDAAGVRVASFKKPTPPELEHDFLWRIHAQVPASGEIVIFNRSHYEDVLIVRVHDLISEKVCRERFRQINQFERMLVENGTTILKFFLHISRDEQKERLQERVDDPTKHWKFNRGDLEERKLWKDYMKAYEEAIEKTSTDEAPWHVVPADRKWYRNYVIGTVVAETMEKFDMSYPKIDLSDVVID